MGPSLQMEEITNLEGLGKTLESDQRSLEKESHIDSLTLRVNYVAISISGHSFINLLLFCRR